MAVVGLAEILVVPSFKGAQKKIAEEMDGAAESPAVKKSGGKMGALMTKGLKVAAKTGFAAVATLGATAMWKGFGRLRAIENARASLVGLGHDAKSVETIMTNANAAVKGTAFGLGDAATVAANLVASGIKPGKDLEKTLTLVGDAATIAGVGIGDMGAVFGKAAASNKVQMDIINQMHDMGVPALQLIAAEMGVTAEEASKMASAGKVDFATFSRAMTTGMGGAAQESGKTLSGAFANSVSAIGRVGANLMSGIYPKITTFFQGLIEWMGPVEDKAKVVGAALAVFADKAILGIKGLFDLVVKGDFTTAFREAFGVEEDHPLVGFLLTVRDAFTKIADALPKVIDSGGKVLKFLWDMREPLTVISGLIITAFIPHWIMLGVEAIKSAKKQSLAWLVTKRDSIKAALSHWKTIGSMVAGWVLLGAQAMIQAVRIAAAWVIALGPVGWIIGAVVAVGAALVLAYHKVDWFRAAVDTAFQWIKDVVGIAIGAVKTAVGAVADWFQNTVAPIFEKAVGAIGGAFEWLRDSVIKPVWDAITGAIEFAGQKISGGLGAIGDFVRGVFGPVFTWLYETIIKPIWGLIQWQVEFVSNVLLLIFDLIVFAVKNFLAPAFVWFYENVIKPVWSNIQKFISTAWTLISAVFSVIVNVVKAVLGAVFIWLWEGIIKPTWTRISGFISTTWAVIKGIFGVVVTYVRNTLGAVFTWLYDSIIKPVWDGIKWFISATWDSIKVVFNAIRDFLRNTLGPVFTWLRDNVIKPVWDAIKNTISSVWNKGIKPVFEALGNFIEDTVAPAFKRGVELIGKFWDGLKAIAKAPVKFIIEDVYNSGIRGTFEKIAKAIGSDARLPEIGLPKGFARGGWTGPGSKYQEAGIVHADEFVVRKESQRSIARKAPGFLDSLNRFGAAALGYADGGLVKPVKGGQVTSGFGASRGRYPHAGIDFAVPTGTPVFASMAGTVLKAAVNAVTGRTGIGAFLGHDGGRNTYYGHLSKLLVGVGDQVKKGQQIALSGNTGNSTGPHLHFETWTGGKPVNPAKYLAGAALPEGGVGGGGGFDLLAPLMALKDQMLGKFSGMFPGGGMIADMGKHMATKAFKIIPDFLMSKIRAIGDYVGNEVSTSGGALKYRGMAADALRHTGDYSLGNLNSLIRRMRQESSFNPRAINNTDSNARRGTPSKGLMQVIDPTFQSYRDRALGNDIWDPFQNTVASIRYAKARYGNVRAGWDRKGGYADGGLVNPMAYLHDQGGQLMPGLSMILNKTGKPEAILNQRQWADIHSLAVSRTTGSGEVSVTVVAPEQATASEYFGVAKHELAVMNRRGGRR